MVLRTPYVVHRHVGFVHHSSALVRLVQRVVLGTAGRFVLARAAAVLAIDEHVATGLARAEVLGNGVDTERFRPAPLGEPGRAAEAGRPLRPLRAQEGFDLVAAAAGDDYEIAFAGGDRPPGVDDPRLRFLGAVAAEQMPAVYAGADIMVVASVGECPLTVLEAMASRLPVVLREDPRCARPGPPGRACASSTWRPATCPPRCASWRPTRPRGSDLGAAGRAHVETAYSWSPTSTVSMTSTGA